jgi:hypothetical protein
LANDALYLKDSIVFLCIGTTCVLFTKHYYDDEIKKDGIRGHAALWSSADEERVRSYDQRTLRERILRILRQQSGRVWVGWIELTHVRILSVTRCCEHGDEPPSAIKEGGFMPS